MLTLGTSGIGQLKQYCVILLSTFSVLSYSSQSCQECLYLKIIVSKTFFFVIRGYSLFISCFHYFLFSNWRQPWTCSCAPKRSAGFAIEKNKKAKHQNQIKQQQQQTNKQKTLHPMQTKATKTKPPDNGVAASVFTACGSSRSLTAFSR